MNRTALIQEIVEHFAKCQRPTSPSHWQKIGLTHAQLGMLFMLSFHKKLQIKQISQYLGISKSAASQIVTPLTEKGFISRHTDPSDRRVVHLVLAPGGNKAIKKLHKMKFAGLRSRLDALSADELNQMAVLCRKMTI